jgi:hypothetical protein
MRARLTSSFTRRAAALRGMSRRSCVRGALNDSDEWQRWGAPTIIPSSQEEGCGPWHGPGDRALIPKPQRAPGRERAAGPFEPLEKGAARHLSEVVAL